MSLDQQSLSQKLRRQSSSSIGENSSPFLSQGLTGSTTSVGSTSIGNSSKPIKLNETDSLRANFTGRSNKRQGSILGSDKQPKTSPLLSSTPPTVSKSLLRAYPYLILANKLLSILTWTGDDTWLSVLVTVSFTFLILYFETIIIYIGHILIVGLISTYAFLNDHLEKEQDLHPTLDDAVQSLTTLSMRSEMLLSPISSLNLSSYDLKRLLFTTIFLSPIYIIMSYFVLPPRTLFLMITIFLLTYHSSWSRVTRKILWKSKTIRLCCFYLTGLDFGSQHSDKNSLFKIAMNKTNTKLKEVYNSQIGVSSGKFPGPIRFTYVLYENQRRWLGIGWTSNLLSYERTAWTDEFLNETDAPEEFELPQLNDDSNMYWRWVDKTWRLDLTNDGSLQLPSSKAKSTANPKTDEGFIYYDNTWKSPSTDDSFSKYTRRRRWIRTAELVSSKDSEYTQEPSQTSSTNTILSSTILNAGSGMSTPKISISLNDVQDVNAKGNITTSLSTTTSATSGLETSKDSSVKKRKSLRFDEAPTMLESSTDSTSTLNGTNDGVTDEYRNPNDNDDKEESKEDSSLSQDDDKTS